jgi:hypothetical protein
MKTDIECGSCLNQLTFEHWKKCGGVQCKCQHYRRHHNRYGWECKKTGCTCGGFESLLVFDDFYGWSKSVKPDVLYTPTGVKTGVKIE